MADSNNPRSHRAHDPLRFGAGDEAPRGGSSDPLAELARLIGQSDPFADLERDRAGSEMPRAAHVAPPEPPLARPAEPPPPANPAYPDTYGAAPAPDYGDALGMPPNTAPYPEQYQAAAPYSEQAPYPQQAPHPEQAYAHPADAHQAAYPQGYQPYYDPYYDADGNILDEAEYHEQQDRQRRRRRLATVIAILCLAVLGGAGAYGYRTLVASGVPASPPPVIKADTAPNKVIPAQSGDTASNKLIYDRVGENAQAEKVVPREETPVDIKTASVSQPSHVVYPGPGANPVAMPTPVPTIAVTRPNPGGQVLPVASEPSLVPQGNGALMASAKKVRTVTIRPDMTVVQSSPVREPAPPTRSVDIAQPPPPTAPARPAAAPPAPSRQTAPLSLSPGDIAASDAPQPAPVRPPAEPRPSRSQPLQLTAVPPAASSAPPPASASGSYVVQVSSQRSEAEAKASYRTLQARYPTVLGGRSSFVRRADLGSRGTYYRTMVGPFATSEQAGQFCSSLKSAGGQCIIHRN